MKYAAILLSTLLMLAACREKAGQPATETTGTAQAAQETGTATATTTAATGGTSSALSPDDKEFVSKAGMGGLAEVQMGNLALSKASSADVKAFGQRMVSDHSKANEELSQLATAKGVALPTELTGEHKDALDHLASLSGPDFDKAYMKHMVEDHQEDVGEFEKASTTATDSDLKAWAGKTLPTLKQHLQLAQTVSSKV
jgi:putative membrane protein